MAAYVLGAVLHHANVRFGARLATMTARNGYVLCAVVHHANAGLGSRLLPQTSTMVAAYPPPVMVAAYPSIPMPMPISMLGTIPMPGESPHRMTKGGFSVSSTQRGWQWTRLPMAAPPLPLIAMPMSMSAPFQTRRWCNGMELGKRNSVASHLS